MSAQDAGLLAPRPGSAPENGRARRPVSNQRDARRIFFRPGVVKNVDFAS
jgi:hypothetical protein